jgi:predicted dinucleotide-binding enzyme
MATLGLIGSGNIGSTLARLAVDAGLDVVLSNSRAPRTLSDLAGELGPQARAATPAQAAAAGDWVVVTIPAGAIGAVPREPLAGETVIDTGNYFAPRDGAIPELEARELTDSELLQRHLAEAHVVKAFSNINYKHLRALPRPVGAADRTALPIAGNDPGAKKHAAELLSLLGYDCVDMGPRPGSGSPRTSSAASGSFGSPRGGGGRARHHPRKTARYQQEHAATGDHRRVGHPARVRRGQRRPHAGEAARPSQSGTRAA